MDQSIQKPINPMEKQSARATRNNTAYCALLVFSFFYYTRPEDFIPGLAVVPLGKITGAIALLALIAAFFSNPRLKIPTAIKVLIALFAQMILAVPFAIWRGGAFSTVFGRFAKAVIIALLISMVVTTVAQLRRLLWIQAATVAAVTFISLVVNHTNHGRLNGVQNGILENPNDLAINIAINFPLCVAFLFGSRGFFRKGLWLFSLAVMMYGVVATYSRSGLIALVISGFICLWEYGVKGKRFYLLPAAGLIVMTLVVVAMATPRYIKRVETLVGGDIRGTLDRGSLEARRQLLKLSVITALQHPLVGIGPGNFDLVAHWSVGHNTYTELAAEAGFPALLLFLFVIAGGFANLRRVRKSLEYKNSKEVQLFTGALWASLLAYLVGAMFASTEYNLFPYFMIGYTCALQRIISGTQEQDANNVNQIRRSAWEGRYEANDKRDLVWKG